MPLFFFLLFTLFSTSATQAQNTIDRLRVDYPLLTERFGHELENQRADYIFAIDVSGTMYKYRESVVPALQAFFRSLQEGDYVSIIKFGGEATNEVGSAGKIGGQTVENLTAYANHLFDKPTSAFEKKCFYDNTDLDNMLHYLADDMKQIDRNDLKFVFIITDFEHDPAAARVGKEDWDGVRQRLGLEQKDNRVFVFALQLPGTARDLEQVHSVLPDHFRFSHVSIANGDALSDWFTQRKNAILLDKFQALVGSKIKPADLSVRPSLSVGGHLSADVSWKPNAVYDRLRVDTLTTQGHIFRFRSRLPVTLTDRSSLNAGRFIYNDVRWSHVRFKKFSEQLTFLCSYDVPYEDELAKLGFAAPQLTANASVNRTLFCYIVPLWLFLLICALILLYIILVVRAFRRNKSEFFRINGKFEVTLGGDTVAGRKVAHGERTVDFGKGAGWMSVPECQWALRIYVKTYSPFLRPLKKPEYRVKMTCGSSFKVVGNKWGVHQEPAIARYSSINIDDYRLKWIQ